MQHSKRPKDLQAVARVILNVDKSTQKNYCAFTAYSALVRDTDPMCSMELIYLVEV